MEPPVSNALVFLVGIISASVMHALAPAVSILVGVGTLSERRRKRYALEIAPDIAGCLKESESFEAWVKERAAHALKNDITIIRSLVQTMAETVKVQGEQITQLGKTSSVSANDIAYIRGKLEGMK